MNEGIFVKAPGACPLRLTELVLDFTGTLSLDGALLPGVAERLLQLGQQLQITVLTADTFGTAEKQLENLPVEVHLIRTGRDKADFITGLHDTDVVAVGNGRNDVDMLRAVRLGIAVIGPEGCAVELIAASDIVTRNILDALDLLLNPLRIKATLRE